MYTKIFLLVTLTLLHVVSGHKSFQAKIPNGGVEIAGSKALGHANDVGGGSRNVFGAAFASAGLKWTKELCQADSDGDGQTNGFELGDPDCCWNNGATPKFVTELSHPGKKNSTSARKSRRRQLGGGHDDDHGDDKDGAPLCSGAVAFKPTIFSASLLLILVPACFL